MTIDEILPPKERLKHRWVVVSLISITDEEAATAYKGVVARTSTDKIASGPVSCADCHFPYEVARDMECHP